MMRRGELLSLRSREPVPLKLATTAGEKIAAERARQRIIDHLVGLEREDPPVEFKISMPDMWSRKLFVALLRRYNLTPYRYKRQRYTTVMVEVSRQFLDERLWPEYEELSKTLNAYLSDVTDRVIREVLDEDTSDANVVEEPQKALSVSPPAPPAPPSLQSKQPSAKEPQGDRQEKKKVAKKNKKRIRRRIRIRTRTRRRSAESGETLNLLS